MTCHLKSGTVGDRMWNSGLKSKREQKERKKEEKADLIHNLQSIRPKNERKKRKSSQE